MLQNKNEIQSFLGFAEYYRKHVKNFASIGRPPYKLCDKDTVFKMTVDRFSKTQIFQPCHKDDTAMDTALLIWNRVISWTEIFTNIINDRDLNLISALWTNLHQLFGTNLSFSTAYHPQTD
ncbi:hypothetical protein O181_027743 [Austropuccinia psidii MF-1]|uniref:Integrase catalytic domain-containing protein n=1 Tax=Austropuccinia psidii MF-1 TaxID=1389203 RepID=A0A9Q3CQ55_9BASI|nr:hypothetical protein [Austropuccinia psidii MF-1]